MTSNEKKALTKLAELKQGNTVNIAGTLRVTINYACDVCNKLCEKGYLEKLSPGRFALYKITSLGKEQVEPLETNPAGRDESPLTEASGGVEGAQRDEKAAAAEYADKSAAVAEQSATLAVAKKAIEEIDEYECTKCGATVKEGEIECPKCGVVFEGDEEEEEAAQPCPEVPRVVPPAPPARRSPGEVGSKTEGPVPSGIEGSSTGQTDSRESKAGILDHPSVPEEWKNCNWKWK